MATVAAAAHATRMEHDVTIVVFALYKNLQL